MRSWDENVRRLLLNPLFHLRACWLLAGLGLFLGGCTAGGPSSQAFSLGIETFPQQVGGTHRVKISRYSDHAPVESWVEVTRLLRRQGDLWEYEHHTRLHGKPVRKALYVVERDQALYMQEGGTPPRQLAEQHQLVGEMLLLKFPLRPQQFWEFVDPSDGPSTREVSVEEQVTVPAGTFKAVVIREQRPGGSGRSWYAPGRGVVRSVMLYAKARLEKELLSFEEPPRGASHAP